MGFSMNCWVHLMPQSISTRSHTPSKAAVVKGYLTEDFCFRSLRPSHTGLLLLFPSPPYLYHIDYFLPAIEFSVHTCAHQLCLKFKFFLNNTDLCVESPQTKCTCIQVNSLQERLLEMDGSEAIATTASRPRVMMPREM